MKARELDNPNSASRFWANVDRQGPNGCWSWLGATRSGYGRFNLRRGRLLSAHRVAYELLVGPIPNGLELDHLCRNPICVNPTHLEPVTHRENVLRGEGVAAKCAAKTRCPQGHPYDVKNTYVDPAGKRTCRICQGVRGRAWHRRKALALQSHGAKELEG